MVLGSKTTMSASAPSCSLPFCRAVGVERSSISAGIRLILRSASISVSVPFSRTYCRQHARKSSGVAGMAFSAIAGDHHQWVGNHLVDHFLRIGENQDPARARSNCATRRNAPW